MSKSPPISIYTEKDMLQMSMFELENEKKLLASKRRENLLITQCNKGGILMGNDIIKWLDENYKDGSNDETHEFFILESLPDYIAQEVNYLNAEFQQAVDATKAVNLRTNEILKEIKGLRVRLNALDENV